MSLIEAAAIVQRYQQFQKRNSYIQALAYVYFEEERGRRTGGHLLTRDEARRIAANIVSLPEFLRAGLKLG
jgi:hypothetical protein